jgi:hypothetical protein
MSEWWGDIRTWTGEVSRTRTVRNGPRKLKGDLLIRGIANLSSVDDGVWSGPVEGYLDVRVSTQDDVGRVSTTFREVLTLSIQDQGYRLDFETDRLGGHREGAFAEDRWVVQGIDIFDEFSPYLDQLWCVSDVRVPISSLLRSQYYPLWATVEVALSRALTTVSGQDVHRERWYLTANAPAESRDYYLEHKALRPPDNPVYPSLDALAGSSPAAHPDPDAPPDPGPPPPPPGPAPDTVSPAVTATMAYRATNRSAPIVHLALHCPALQQAASFEKEALDAPVPASAAARVHGETLCGHCAKLLAPRPSQTLFESADGSLTIYEDRLRFTPEPDEDIVLLLRPPLRFSCTGGLVFRSGLELADGAVTLRPQFADRQERDAAAEQLRESGVAEY